MPIYKNKATGKTVHGTYGKGRKKQASSLKKKGYVAMKSGGVAKGKKKK
tara:strand:+ start:159 stop:305 length:147 start_codon:yes stop_codon:yes gene_type:complete